MKILRPEDDLKTVKLLAYTAVSSVTVRRRCFLLLNSVSFHVSVRRVEICRDDTKSSKFGCISFELSLHIQNACNSAWKDKKGLCAAFAAFVNAKHINLFYSTIVMQAKIHSKFRKD